jgi:hypothetical protein
VEDNGFGLDTRNWEAFVTTDTDNKIQIGGKGVGRLLWLDCFLETDINSVFDSKEGRKRCSFQFVLALEDQIQNYEITDASGEPNTSFHVRFSGLRENGYREKFPGRGSYVFQHLTSHFLPIFIGGRCPLITVNVGCEIKQFPDAINSIVYRKDPEILLETEEYGTLQLTLMECDKVASSDLKGSHFVHFIAHDRTVHSQCIDSKLGLKYFGAAEDRVFHGILTGEYLNNNVDLGENALGRGDRR